jgi:hypothetical protein
MATVFKAYQPAMDRYVASHADPCSHLNTCPFAYAFPPTCQSWSTHCFRVR